MGKLTNGLPKHDVGRIALATDPRTPKSVFAIISSVNTEKGFYRSDDQGATWKKLSSYTGGGPAYYSEIFIDPWRADTIWSVNTPLEWSRDGGKTFTAVPNMASVGVAGQYVHVDFHDVTFDPVDRNHAIVTSDGGLYESYDADQLRRRGRALAVLHEPADHAVVSCVGGRGAALLPRLRRRAGQLLGVRSVAHELPLRHPADLLGDPHAVGLLGVPVIARQHVAHRIAPSRLADKAHRRTTSREPSVRVLVLTKARVGRGDPDVAGQIDLVSQIPGVAVRDHHHGLGTMRLRLAEQIDRVPPGQRPAPRGDGGLRRVHVDAARTGTRRKSSARICTRALLGQQLSLPL